jgi:hypothetical protein
MTLESMHIIKKSCKPHSHPPALPGLPDVSRSRTAKCEMQPRRCLKNKHIKKKQGTQPPLPTCCRPPADLTRTRRGQMLCSYCPARVRGLHPARHTKSQSWHSSLLHGQHTWCNQYVHLQDSSECALRRQLQSGPCRPSLASSDVPHPHHHRSPRHSLPRRPLTGRTAYIL